MNKRILSIATYAGALIILTVCSSMVHAQATRTWIQSDGDDVNPCSRLAPCKTFAGAISKTAPGGEISVADSGSYGVLSINKALTISGDGSFAGITAALSNGIQVNAGANDTVIIRNISINGISAGSNGIRYQAGKHLIVENTTIYGVASHGIDVALSAAGRLSVNNTSIQNCGNTAINIGSGGTPAVVLDNVQIRGCGTGIAAAAGNTTISRSIISQNTNQALLASGSGAVINAESCVLSNNGTGVSASVGGATVRLSNCVVTGNATGISASAGNVISFGNNKISGNTTNGAPTTLLAQQ